MTATRPGVLCALAGVAAIGLAPVAFAQAWTTYANERWHYEAQIPPGFVEDGADEDGAYYSAEAGAKLTVFGDRVFVDGGFPEHASQHQFRLVADGWDVERVDGGATFMVYAGTREGEVLHARIEAICGNTALAGFVLSYVATAAAMIEPLIPQLDEGLVEGDC